MDKEKLKERDALVKDPSVIEVKKKVESINLAIAAEISQVLKEKKIFCVNLLGAPGSGKTTVIEGIAQELGAGEMAVIQGDLESDIDKVRLEQSGISTYQINTHSGCHLNAKMISEALQEFSLEGKKYLIIENVGNLVCPAGKQIGQDINVVVSSTTEGSDKPKKYPVIFLDASMVLLSKYDLAEAVEFNSEQYEGDILALNRSVSLVRTTHRDGKSFEPLAALIRDSWMAQFA